MGWHRSLVLLLACLAVIIAFILGTRKRQPHYQGRNLHEWLIKYSDDRQSLALAARATDGQALLAMRTNAIPQLVEWIQKDRSPQTSTLFLFIPRYLLRRWPSLFYIGADGTLAVYGFELLNSNAVSALPELTKLANDPRRPYVARRAIQAIARLGPAAYPVLTNTLADPNNLARAAVVTQLQLQMAPVVGTNACIPPLLNAVNDRDPDVRYLATNALHQLAPEVLTNTPSQ